MLKFPKAQISRHPVHLFDSIRPPRDFNPPIRRIDVKSIDLPEERALFPGWFRLISYPVLRRRQEIMVAPPGRETDTRGSGSETVVVSSSSTTDGRRLRAGDREAAPRLHGRNAACARRVNESAPRQPPPPPPPPLPPPPPPRNSHAGDTRVS